MGIRIKNLSLASQIKYGLLSKNDQADILNCSTVEEAEALLEKKKDSVRLQIGRYEPKLQISGSSAKYKTKNLFTEEFDEKDVRAFITLAESSESFTDEEIQSELNREFRKIIREGRQPLQCAIYATKQNEKVFYNNQKKVEVWAYAIADFVNENTDYVLSINHMLVNWSMWKYQLTLLIMACGHIRENEKLDEVIRDLYVDYDDDKVRYTVMRRLLHGLNKDNYQSAFIMLRNADFIGNAQDRKYFNALKRKVENSTREEREALYAAFRGTQGFGGAKRKRIENLFVEREDSGIIKRINESDPDQKDAVLKEVHGLIYGTQKQYREIAALTRDIRQYQSEIQEMFIQKLECTTSSAEDLKVYGMAVINLDTEGRAIPILENLMLECVQDEKRLMFAYVLATASDDYICKFIELVLTYNGASANSLLNSVRNFYRPGKDQIVRQYLYSNCLKILNEFGIDSGQFTTALRNLGEFLRGGQTITVYDVKFDQLLFDFLGYDRTNRILDDNRCSSRNATLVIRVLENVMDKTNYEGRYERFMWDLYARFKTKKPDLANQISEIVRGLTSTGTPTGNLTK